MIEYTNINKELKIKMISTTKNLIFLEDGSRWEITLSKKGDASHWQEGDVVVIFDPGYQKRIPSSDYKIKNVTREEIVQAFVLAIKRDDGASAA
ncbi:MAG TPA: hypothetical protein PLY88_08805 [Candidatus Omnitrophota bacterium]|nr:hypothetical protein [Candidatus Omnitrophota bacterium]HRK62624.1 hypothetical protein [Candidatus Omnitrophota bacterium]